MFTFRRKREKGFFFPFSVTFLLFIPPYQNFGCFWTKEQKNFPYSLSSSFFFFCCCCFSVFFIPSFTQTSPRWRRQFIGFVVGLFLSGFLPLNIDTDFHSFIFNVTRKEKKKLYSGENRKNLTFVKVDTFWWRKL